MSKQSSRSCTIPVNEKVAPQISRLGIQLVPLFIRRPGTDDSFSDELFFAPICDECGEVITRFDEGNLVTVYRDSQSQNAASIPLGQLGDDASLHQLPGIAIIVHKRCDKDRTYPWKPLDTILKSDQRYSFEKPLLKQGGRSRRVLS